MLRIPPGWIAFFICLLFVATGLPWIGETGVQSDEALFSGQIYRQPWEGRSVMLMSYVGAVKSYIYAPIFALWKPSAASVRVPAILLGGLTIGLVYLAAKRALGVKAALITTTLLATDTTFLFSTRWDWGPVVLQHLCFAAGMLGFVTFARTSKYRWLAMGAFVFGLGMWDKALFSWSLAALFVATAIVFPRELRSRLNWRSVFIGTAAFLLGAAPLLKWNADHRWATFRENTVWSADEILPKAEILKRSIDGFAWGGTIMRANWDGPVRPPDDGLKKAIVWISDVFGSPERSLQVWVLLAALLLAPFTWRSENGRAFLFSFIYLVVAWVLMTGTHNAGGSVHHVVLLWPIPQFLIGSVFSRVRGGSLVLLTCLASLLVTATYYRNMLRNGGVPAYSDAIYPASQFLAVERPERVCALDWGFFDNLRVLNQGRLAVVNPNQPGTDGARWQLAQTNTVFITHTKEAEIQPGSTSDYVSFAIAEGYQKTDARIFNDYNGRPIIEVFRLTKMQLP